LAAISGTVATLICVGVAFAMGPPAQAVLLAGSALPVVMVVRGAMSGFLRARRRVMLVEGSNALAQVLYSGGAMAAVALGSATAPRVAIVRVVAFASGLVLWFPLWRRLSLPQSRRPGSWRRLLSFSWPLLIAGVAWLVLQRSDVILLGFFKGVGAVGLYFPILQI